MYKIKEFNVESILKRAVEMKEELVQWRRHLHQNPELSFEEFETSKFVNEKLKSWGYDTVYPIAKTGVITNIIGLSKGPTIALRADMDALPIKDEKNVDYCSKVEGVGHLCGHDAHTAILLGVAKLLKDVSLSKGNIKLIFQPAEEGLAGAKYMIEDGALESPTVDVIAGLHIHPTAATGKITVADDVAMATSDAFDIEIIGEGGHAAHPHMSIDSIVIASQVISSLQQIVSRRIDPLESTVITIGKIEGGYKRNVIAPSVKLEGTVRILNKNLREEIRNTIESFLKGICNGMGATYSFNYMEGYPSVVNSDQMVNLLEETSKKVLGENNFYKVKPSMGGEDFAYFAEKVPGVFFRLGTYNENKNSVYPNHHPKFDIDEDSLPIGVAMLIGLAFEYLNK